VGLTLATLEWAIEAAGDRAIPAFERFFVESDAVHARGEGAFATLGGGDTWFAVRTARSSLHDLRYDFGLVGLKVADAEARWRDLVPPRPRTLSRPDSAGPILTTGGGSVGYPEATSLSTRPNVGITARGGFRTRSGRWLRRGVRFEFVQRPCGVRLSFPVARGDRFEFSAFFTGKPTLKSDSAADAAQVVSLNRPASSSLTSGYSSGAHARLYRVRFRFPRAARAGSTSITTCER
jgi:hypothetical protein